MGSFVNTLEQYEAAKSPLGQAAYYAATGTPLTPQQISAAQNTNPGLALASSIIGRYRRGGAGTSASPNLPQGPPAPTTTSPTQPTQGTAQTAPLDLINNYSTGKSAMPKEAEAVGPASSNLGLNIGAAAGSPSSSSGNGGYGGNPSNSGSGINSNTGFPGNSGGNGTTGTSDSTFIPDTDPSTYGTYPGDEDPGDGGSSDPGYQPPEGGDGPDPNGAATGAMMGKGGGMLKVGEAGPEVAGGRIVTQPSYVHLDKGETVIPLTPSSKNKMQPDLLEGHVAPPHVPGVNYSRYQRYGSGRGLMR